MGKRLLTLALVSLFVCGGGIFSVNANDLIGKEVNNQKMNVYVSSVFETPAELIRVIPPFVPGEEPVSRKGEPEPIPRRGEPEPVNEPIINPLEQEALVNIFESLRPGMSAMSSDGWIVEKNEDGSGYIRNDDMEIFIAIDPAKPISSPIDPSKPISSPIDPSKPISSPIDPSKPISSPIDPSKPISSPIDPSKPISSPIDPSKPISSPIDPSKPISSPIDPSKPISSPIDPSKPISSPIDPSKPISSPIDPSKPISSPIDPGSEPVDKPQTEDPSKVIFNPDKEPLDPLLEEMLNLFESLEPGVGVERSDGWVVVKNKDGSGYIRNDDIGAYINFGPKGKIINIQWPAEEVFSLEN